MFRDCGGAVDGPVDHTFGEVDGVVERPLVHAVSEKVLFLDGTVDEIFRVGGWTMDIMDKDVFGGGGCAVNGTYKKNCVVKSGMEVIQRR